jgi:hypothetical protein
MIAYNKYMVANRVEEIIKTFNYFPTPEMIAQLNQELEPMGKAAVNDLELYMRAKSEEFMQGLRDLISSKAAEMHESISGEAPVYVKQPGHLLKKAIPAKNWPKIGVGKSSMGGRGVFALQPMTKGELIEEAPYVVVPRELLQSEPICDYLFMIDEERCAVVFGYGSVYNHNNQPNLSYTVDPASKSMQYYAKREIAPGEELTVTYGKDWFHSRGTATK